MNINATTKTGAPRKKQWASKVRTGCLTCRKRRVKCDEAKPNCNRCIAVNRECVGAAYGINHEPEVGESAKKMISPRLLQEPSSPVQFCSSQDMIELGRMIPELEKKLLVTSALDTPTEICLALSCSKMYHCLGMLPCRAGYEPSLDSAAKCVVMGLRERFIFGDSPEFNTTPVPVNSLGAYVDALKPLRQALCDPARSQRPEVLCAAQLLGIFESLIQNRPHLRFQHVFGAEQLIQYRGTHGFSTPFEQNLLLAQVPVIIGHSLPSYQKPFLADDEWMAVLETCAQAGNEFVDRKLIDMYQAHLMVCSIFPDVMSYIINGEYDKVKHDFLLFRIRGVLDRLSTWRRNYEIRDLVSDTAPGIQYSSPTTSDASYESSLDIGLETSDACSDSYSSTPYGDDETSACNTDTYTMMANRLYIALGGKGSVQLEAQTQHIANKLLDRHSIRSDTIESFTDGHILLSMGAARAMLATANDFAAFAAVGERAAACGRHAMIPSSFFEDLLNHYGFPPPPKPGNSNYSESTTY